MTRLLVLAPRFPSINQPWMDTYLEQLLRCGLDPVIYSSLKETGPYAEKVDRLGLRQRILRLTHSRGQQLSSLLAAWRRPQWAGQAWALTGLNGLTLRERLGAWVKTLYLGRALEGEALQLIHAHEEISAYEFLHAARLLDLPLVVTFHGLPPSGVGNLSLRKRAVLYRHAARVLVNTRFAREQVTALGCPPEKVTTLPQGLPLEDFPFEPSSPPANGKPIKLLTVGRYHRDKGQGYALVALRRLLDRGISAQWTFVGVGQGRATLQQLAAKLQLQDHVQFLENVPSEELVALYQQHHCFVLPSITSTGGHVETQGVVLQEAQASGCIPIASRVGGIPECLNHEQDALLVSQKSSRALADAVQFLLDRPEQWQGLQKAGRENVERNYAADLIGDRMASILRTITGEESAGSAGRPERCEARQ